MPDGFLNVVFAEDSDGKIMMCSHYECSELPEHCYRIEGNNIYADEDSILLAYTKDPTEDTMLDLSASLFAHLAAIAANLLNGEISAAEEKAEKAAILSKGDKRGVIPDPPMWWG